MAARLVYTDDNGVLTQVDWYEYDEVITDYYEFCGSPDPLAITWYGKRYSGLRGSKASINVLIQSQADKDELDKMLNKSYCVTVTKAPNDIIWIGKMHPQFFTEPYKDRPIVIQLNASDHIGQFDKKQFILTDFPIPYTWETPNYVLLDIFNKALTDPTVIPKGAINPCAPTRLNIACRLYEATKLWEAFEKTGIDPNVFLKFGEKVIEYPDKQTMLNQILEVMYMKLFQWGGEWWLMSLDAQWDAGEITYKYYDLDWSTSWVYGGQATINPPILDICDPIEDYILRTGGTLRYLSDWSGVELTKKFVRNTEVIPSFANRDGRFFRGDANTYLEFGPTVTYPIFYTQVLRWDYITQVARYFPENNSGNIAIIATGDVNADLVIHKEFFVGENKPTERIKIHMLVTLNKPNRRAVFQFRMKYRIGLYERWLTGDNFGSGYSWQDVSGQFLYETTTEQYPEEINIDVPRPGDEVDGDVDMEFDVLTPTIEVFDDQDNTGFLAIFKNIRMEFENEQWANSDYEQVIHGIFEPVIINPLGETPIEKRSYIWGITHSSFNNKWHYHLSAPYSVTDGRPLQQEWYSQGSPAGVRTMTEWLLDHWQEDNYNYSAQLSIQIQNFNLTPLNLIRDFEGRIYVFTSGTLHDKSGNWENVYDEAKWIRNVPGIPVKCDFETQAYNNDFCFFI